VLIALSAPAGADTLEERFSTMWESLWTQNGAPALVTRWGGEIRVRFTGSEAAGHRDYAWRPLREAAELAGIPIRDVTGEPDAAGIANLEFQLLTEEEMAADETARHMMCRAQLQRARQFLIEKVLVQARARRIVFCGYHEVMHAMGIRGHPTGETVLRYFTGKPRDAFLPMDEALLKGWYSPRMKPGATAFEALVVLTDVVIETTVDESQREAARAAQAAFIQRTLREMERYARGERSEERRVGKECRSRWSPYH